MPRNVGYHVSIIAFCERSRISNVRLYTNKYTPREWGVGGYYGSCQVYLSIYEDFINGLT